MPKEKIYIVITSQRDYYSRDSVEAEEFASKWHGEIQIYESLESALKDHNLTPIGQSSSRDAFLPAIRVTREEREQIQRQAREKPLSDYIREKLGFA